jgi:flagellar biosynthesis/type III secretory pathway protein FliH
MLSPHKFIDEIIASLRNVIAPAIADPYPKAQAYMAAVILEYVTRQVEERTDAVAEKQQELAAFFRDVGKTLADHGFSQVASTVLDNGQRETTLDQAQEERLCRLIEALYAHREEMGPELFAELNQRVRASLRRLLDQELKVVRR